MTTAALLMCLKIKVASPRLAPSECDGGSRLDWLVNGLKLTRSFQASSIRVHCHHSGNPLIDNFTIPKLYVRFD